MYSMMKSKILIVFDDRYCLLEHVRFSKEVDEIKINASFEKINSLDYYIARIIRYSMHEI